MDERIRRVIIFVIIVGAGTLFLFIDVPLILIIPLILVIGLILLIVLGALPVAELKSMLSARFSKGGKKAALGAAKTETKSPVKVTPDEKQKRLPFGLDSLFKKKEGKTAAGTLPAGAQKPAAAPAGKARVPFSLGALLRKKNAGEMKGNAATAPQKTAEIAGKKKGVSLHIGSLVSSVKALGTLLTTRKKTDPDKLRKIDTMLDYAVTERPNEPSPAVLPGQDITVSAPGGAGTGGGGGAVAEEDPFLSLSNDELESGLLDDLDEEETETPVPESGTETSGLSIPLPEDMEALPLGDSDMPVPPQEVVSSADDILKENEPEMTDLPDLEGIETVDENLGELDNLSMDTVELEDDLDDEENVPEAAAPAAGTPAPAAGTSAPQPAAHAPAGSPGGGPGKSDQSEMAAFAAASGGDDDMLSSLAADIKTVKKDQDISLLRELKDFRAPGATIETELTDLYTTLNTATEKQKKIRASSKKTATGKKPAPK